MRAMVTDFDFPMVVLFFLMLFFANLILAFDHLHELRLHQLTSVTAFTYQIGSKHLHQFP